MQIKDKKLLLKLQSRFPITCRPYLALGEALGLSEQEVQRRVNYFRKKGIIRRIGPVLENKKIGYCSALVAMQVARNKIKPVVSYINKLTNVSHNYLRDNEYNLWFTLTARSGKKLNQLVKTIKKNTGIRDILFLPANKTFKIKAEFTI